MESVVEGASAVDLLIVVYFVAFFVLGFAQGAIRRLLGIASMLFSFLLAANLARPLGDFLSANWTQFPPEYSYMIGFLTVFVAGVVAFTLVIQSYYHPQPLFERARFADEAIGGILGLVQAALLFGIVLGDPRLLLRTNPGSRRTLRSCRSCATCGMRSTGRSSPSRSGRR